MDLYSTYSTLTPTISASNLILIFPACFSSFIYRKLLHASIRFSEMRFVLDAEIICSTSIS